MTDQPRSDPWTYPKHRLCPLSDLLEETKDRSPRRETTRSLYLDIDANSELEGRIIARELVEKNRPEFNVEYIELLSDKLLDYEKETGAFEITEF